MAFFSSKVSDLFPPRKRGQTDGELRKQLISRQAPRDASILTKTELEIIHQLIAGTHSSSFNNTSHNASFQNSNGSSSSNVNNNNNSLNADALAQEKKRKMLEYDEMCKKNGLTHKTAEEIEEEQAREQCLERAKNQLDEQFDEVKAMNKILKEAECVAVRNAQREERARMKANEKYFNAQMDEVMAAEAAKAEAIYAAREAARVAEMKRNVSQIEEQLKERELNRMQQLKRAQQEQEAMEVHMRKVREEEKAEKIRRQDAARRAIEEAALANAEQLILKQKQAELIKEEERQIEAYLRAKEAREQALLDEQQRIREEKEKEIAKIRATQEKAQDKRAELDELRAKRVQEAFAREQRKQDAANAAKARAVQDELKRARIAQAAEKQKMNEEIKRLEREEVERLNALQAIAAEQEKEEAARMRALQEENALTLLQQMMEIEERRRKAKVDEIEEGHQQEKALRERAAALETIRKNKLKQLESMQVPDHYRQALLKAEYLEHEEQHTRNEEKKK